jgi:hypothetical protein
MGVSVVAPYAKTGTRSTRHREWLSFFAQVLIVASVELSDEFVRGMVAQSNSHLGQIHAADVVHFEAVHGFWVEPAWQLFFERTHHILGLVITWGQVVPVINFIYVFGHVMITLAFAMWVFFYRRGLFAFLRNVLFVTNALALVLYEAYPLAPPRLTTGLVYAGRPFRFVDTLFQVLDPSGHVAGTKIGFNEFAAMPSLHVGWSIVVGLTLAWVLRPVALRLLALVYPGTMLVTVVVTGNHYLMDAVGALGCLISAVVLASLYAWLRSGRRSPSVLYRQLRRSRYSSRGRHVAPHGSAPTAVVA